MKEERRSALVIRAERVFSAVASDPARERRSAEELAAEARLVGDDEALAVALRAAGYAARELYEHQQARVLLDEAVEVARAAQLADRLCEALITRSAMRIELAQPQRARRDLAEARAVASPRLRAEVDFAEGLMADKAGDFATAAQAYRRALDSLDGAVTAVRIKTLNNLALTVARFGRHREAEELLEEAIAAAGSRWKARRGVAMESYAMVAVDGGRPVEALRRYERAERLLTEVGVQLVDLYIGKARALLTLRLLDEAATAADQAIAAVEGREGGAMMLAEALLPAARIALARGQHGDAIAAAGRAEELFRRQRRVGWRAAAALIRSAASVRVNATPATALRLDRVERTMVEIRNVAGVVEAALLQGEVSAELGRRRKARQAFQRAADAAAGGPLLLRLQGRTAAARSAELDGDARRVAQMCRLGLDDLAAYRASIGSAELRARVASHGMALAQTGLRTAVRAGRPEQVWGWLERSSALAFIGRSGPSDDDDELRPLLAQLRALERDLDEIPPDDTEGRRAVVRGIVTLERRIRRASWTGAPERGDRWAGPSVRALRRLRAGLGSRALLHYGMVDGHLVAVAVTSDRIRYVRLGGGSVPRTAGQQLGTALRRMTQRHASAPSRRLARDSALHELTHLDDLLVSPLDVDVTDVDEVVVVPPRQLIGIPWGSLPTLERRPVCVAPSATAWSLSQQRTPVRDPVVLLAGPGLAHASREVREVSAQHASALVLEGAAATSEALCAAAEGAAVVHIAAHGRLRADSPTFSAVQLADGPLTVHDLEGLAAPAHRWVLASCDLGRPGTLAGPALEGVIASLLAGGSAAVVAATASVPDLDTAGVMVELHTRVAAGQTTAEALWGARSAVDRATPDGFVAGVAFSCYGGG